MGAWEGIPYTCRGEIVAVKGVEFWNSQFMRANLERGDEVCRRKMN
jgi:hypothetical protein